MVYHSVGILQCIIFNTYIMKQVKFYPSIYQTIPYSFDVIDQWNAEGKTIKDLVLKNNIATKQGVSEMTLNIIKLSAININGQEHFIKGFKPKAALHIKGLHTGHFLKAKTVLQLGPGQYTSFRFYVEKAGNSFVYSDKSAKVVSRYDHLDFQIEDGLEIYEGEASEAILRFDFQPYDLPVFFKKLGSAFSNARSFMSSLVQSMEHRRIKI